MEPIYKKIVSLIKDKQDSEDFDHDYELFLNSDDWEALTKCKDINWVLDRNTHRVLINAGYLGCFLGCTLKRDDSLQSLIHTYCVCG